MRKPTEKRNATDFIRKIAFELGRKVPPTGEMVADLKMMRFKIRPISGDLFTLNSGNRGSLLISMWRLGKIEETVRVAFKTLPTEEMESLFDYLDEIQEKFNQGFGYDENGTFFANTRPTRMLRLEIFRDSISGDAEN